MAIILKRCQLPRVWVLFQRIKKPGGEEANPHAGFLNINLASLGSRMLV
jgi:hypothetical protein